MSSSVPLRFLRRRQHGIVERVEWQVLTLPEARRLRELGLDEGVNVELIRGSGPLGGPIACRIGRMSVALRRHVADAVMVQVAS